MKVAINRCWGGFGLSKKAVLRYAEIKGIKLYPDDSSKFYVLYYLVPKEVYEKANAKDKKKGNYQESNKMCFSVLDIERDDPVLIQVIEELGKEADGPHAKIEVVDIPDGIKYEIDEYDGRESIHEEHRSW